MLYKLKQTLKIFFCSYFLSIPCFASKTIFPVSGIVADQVHFWQKIFGHYPSTQIVIHDMDNPRIIIDIIDTKNLPDLHKEIFKKNSSSFDQKKSLVLKAYLSRYEKGLERFRVHGQSAISFGKIEKRLYEVYSQRDDTLNRLLTGFARIRSQSGLSDQFYSAAKKASYYLPFMEKTFAQNHIPIKITRLPFVESMFNLQAISKVGASGIWQFMPQTAKPYMHINHVVDERNNPLKATKSAAKLLADNFRVLNSWPLAITAYNHGQTGMKRAVQAVGSDSLNEIIKNYEAKSFGFASKNFYSEFIAASSIFDRMKNPPKSDERFNLSSIVLPNQWTIKKVLSHLPLSRESLQNHNPCIKDSAFTSGGSKSLPSNFEIFIPSHLVSQVKYQISKAKFPDKKKKSNKQ